MKRTRSHLLAHLLAGAMLVLALAAVNPAIAQTSATDETMRLIASRSVGMPESAFEVSSTDAVFTVLRVNSTMNASTHQGRNNEAIPIANAIAAEFTRIGGRYSTIMSISVAYVERTGTPAHDRIIDRVEFRKNPAGRFELHMT
jgi:hypothetical protein